MHKFIVSAIFVALLAGVSMAQTQPKGTTAATTDNSTNSTNSTGSGY
jgi:hypothetical protein